MGDILRIVLLTVCAAGIVLLLVREVQREHQRQELAKKNMSFLESINLTGLPIITFHNGDRAVNMVLDTGSNVCLINQAALEELKHTIWEKHEGVVGVSGDTEGGLTVMLPLVYKDWEFEIECWSTDMQATIDSVKQEYGVTIHGILGTGFFMKYKYILDFNEMIAYSIRRD